MGCARVGAYCIRPPDVSGRKREIDSKRGRLFLAFRIFFSSLDGRKGPCRGWEVFPGTFLRPITYPAKFPGLGEALIFFCLLFFHQGKAPAGAAKFAGYMNGVFSGRGVSHTGVYGQPLPGQRTCRGVLHTPHQTDPAGPNDPCQPGTKKGIPICLGMPFNHSGVSVGRMQFAPTTGYPIPPAA